LSKAHASSGIAQVEFKEDLSFRPIPQLRVFSDASVAQFANNANNKEGKKVFLSKKVS
jgi:hypothetical protein